MASTDHLPKNVVVLGADGFIGSHLLEALLRDGGCRVVGWDRERVRTGHLPEGNAFRFRHGDIRSDIDSLEADIRHADVVVNLAALCNPSMYGTRTIDVIESNFVHVEPVVRMCASHGTRLVHFSTSEIFGRTLRSWLPDGSLLPEDADLMREDDTPFLLGPLSSTRWSYACAKQLSERLVEAYGRERNLSWTIVRPFNFLGPRMDYLPGIEGEGVPRVLACFVRCLVEREPLPLVDGGRARRAFLHIDDAIDGLLRILRRPEASRGRVFHLGHPGNETDIRGLAVSMRRIWADLRQDPSILDIPLRDVPAAEFYGAGYDDSDRRFPSIAAARELLGWEPRADLETTLRRTLEDYHRRFPEKER